MDTVRFTFTAGAMIKGTIRRSVKEYCFERGYRLDMDEDKGWLDSLFTVRMVVPHQKYQYVMKDVNDWASRLEKIGK